MRKERSKHEDDLGSADAAQGLRIRSHTVTIRAQSGTRWEIGDAGFRLQYQTEIRREDPELIFSFKPPYRVEVKFNPPIIH